KVEHNVDRYSRTPVAGLVVLGSTGEAVMLSDDERREVLRITGEVAAPEKVLVAGVGAESVTETLRMAEYAARLNYDVALVRTPHFYRPQMKPEAMLAFYRTVADRSPLPVLLCAVRVPLPPRSPLHRRRSSLGSDRGVGGPPKHHRDQAIRRKRGKSCCHGGCPPAREANRHGHRSPTGGDRAHDGRTRGPS